MIKILDKKIKSEYKNIEYIELQVNFNNHVVEDLYQYLRIEKNKYNALEIGFLREKNKEISEITLIRTNSYQIIDNDYIEKEEYQEKTLSLTKQGLQNVDIFNLEIYNNAIILDFSNKKSTKNILCGQTLFKLDENNNILNIILLNVSEEVRNHTIEELKYANE